MTLPTWLLKQIFQPYGARLPKRPKKLEKWEHLKPYQFKRQDSSSRYLPERTFEGKIVHGNLGHAEYRFWCGSQFSEANWSQCRACFETVFNEFQRKAHMEEKKCTRKLTDSYKMLLGEKLCIVCQKECAKTNWGVYLCSDTCKRKWMFFDTQPALLADALELIEEKGKGIITL